MSIALSNTNQFILFSIFPALHNIRKFDTNMMKFLGLKFLKYIFSHHYNTPRHRQYSQFEAIDILPKYI